jgi:hypothetical protein
MPPPRPTLLWVPLWVIRQRFNEGRYREQVESGVLRAKLLDEGHPSPPKASEPTCTRSQLLGYFDQQGRKVAEVHQYVRPDETLGASGMPDPKRLREGDTILVADPEAELDPTYTPSSGDEPPPS